MGVAANPDGAASYEAGDALGGRTLFRVYDSLDEVPTFAERLRRSGDDTFVTGKWHQSEFGTRPQLRRDP